MVLLKDLTIRHWFEDVHDHDDYDCDLEQFLASNKWIRTHCYRTPTAAMPSLCNCLMCSGVEIDAVKRNRAQWRVARQQLLKTRFEDLDDEIDWGRNVIPRGLVGTKKHLRGQYYVFTSKTRRGGNTDPVE